MSAWDDEVVTYSPGDHAAFEEAVALDLEWQAGLPVTSVRVEVRQPHKDAAPRFKVAATVLRPDGEYRDVGVMMPKSYRACTSAQASAALAKGLALESA